MEVISFRSKCGLLYQEVLPPSTVQLLVADFEQSHECDVKLLMACATYRYEEVERLLQKPLAPDFTRDFGWTALHTAAWAGSSKCISLLLEAQADLDRQDWFGSTPLYLAAERNQLEAVWLLVAAGADESKAANDGSRPLDIAASCCSKGFYIL